jgi:hypothetical protein
VGGLSGKTSLADHVSRALARWNLLARCSGESVASPADSTSHSRLIRLSISS